MAEQREKREAKIRATTKELAIPAEDARLSGMLYTLYSILYILLHLHLHLHYITYTIYHMLYTIYGYILYIPICPPIYVRALRGILSMCGP